uniref:tetrahydrofolate synthase n=2 Tax=Schistocephalus solidus TaxID=70667 RepID=A0A0X3P1V2_SCHSO
MHLHEVNYCTSRSTYESVLVELNRTIYRTQELGPERVPAKRRRANLISKRFLDLCGISPSCIRKLNVIHVAGSKGKGSTCALIESILREKGLRTGSLNSPHLIDVEERIRLNGRPLHRDVFTSRFWELHDVISGGIEMDDGERILPTYLVYLTTLAFKTFVEEQVDVAVIEVGLGGRFDHTNLVEDPAVTVVTGIHLEHTERLGNTIEEIAWNKAGIFKPGVPAVIAHNIAAGAMRVFEHEAELVKCPLFVAPSLHELRSWTANDPKVLSQLDACIKDLPVSRSTEINAPLALAAVYLWSSRSAVCRENIDFKPLVFDGLSGLQPPLSFGLDAKQLQGLSSARWPGRFERIELGAGLTIFLDCAHTNESVQVLGRISYKS